MSDRDIRALERAGDTLGAARARSRYRVSLGERLTDAAARGVGVTLYILEVDPYSGALQDVVLSPAGEVEALVVDGTIFNWRVVWRVDVAEPEPLV